MQRAYNININGQLSRVVGGEKAGRFRAVIKKDNKRNQKSYNFPRIIKFVIGMVLFSAFCSTLEVSTEPFNKPEPAKAQAQEWAFPQTFMSADMPKEETIEEIIARYFPENPDKAIKIAKCESNYYQEPVGWKPWIHNSTPPDDSWGLFQINLYGKLKLSRPTPEQLKDPETNIKFARGLWESKKTFANDWVVCNGLYNKGKLK